MRSVGVSKPGCGLERCADDGAVYDPESGRRYAEGFPRGTASRPGSRKKGPSVGRRGLSNAERNPLGPIRLKVNIFPFLYAELRRRQDEE